MLLVVGHLAVIEAATMILSQIFPAIDIAST